MIEGICYSGSFFNSCLTRRAVFVRSYLEFGDSVGIALSIVIVEVRERYVRESSGLSSELKLPDFFPLLEIE